MYEGAPFRPLESFPDPADLQVYEHGWQSWSPSGLYPAVATSPRPRRPIWQTLAFRPERAAPDDGFQGEGLLAVVRPDGSAVLWSGERPTEAVPSIRANVDGDQLQLTADGDVERHEHADGLAAALAAWADRHSPGGLRQLGTGWCSWYCHWAKVTAADVLGALDAVARHELAIDLMQIDDGYQANLGDWTEWSPTFGSLPEVVDTITAAGKQAGIWTAPLMVGSTSRFASVHPDLLVGDALAAEHAWGQRVGVLDVTNPAGEEHLHEVFATLRSLGITYFKCDFLYAGAMAGRRHGDADPIAAYRHALGIIRDAIGPESVLLGCGAPLLPSIGLVDAMRVSPDTGPNAEPVDGDTSQPASRSAMNGERARRFQHGRLWINDPDCLLVRAEVERRDEWVQHVATSGGLVVNSDPLELLGGDELDLLRSALRPTLPEPVPCDLASPEGQW